MSLNIKPLTVYGHWGGPNPWKVATILQELKIPYDWHEIEFANAKDESYTKINPNGRLPSIIDPNTGITLWESAAIILYLVDQYDKEGKISYSAFPERYHCQQWLMFQISGQAPYTGQATWFARFHPEKLPSAITRYANEIIRVISVIDKHLATNNTQYLVGDKCTYADLAFVTWAGIGKGLLKEIGREKEIEGFERYEGWMGRLEEREVVRGVAERVVEGRKAHGLP